MEHHEDLVPQDKHYNHEDPHYHMHGHLHNHRSIFQPWYDDRADHNTNAKSYYDYLARHNGDLDKFIALINRLLARNVLVEDTKCVDLTKTGDWIDNGSCSLPDPNGLPTNYDDIVTLKADVILSKKIEVLNYANWKNVTAPNAIKCLDDGLYSRDYSNVLNRIDNETTIFKDWFNKIGTQIGDIYTRIDKLLQSVGTGGFVEVPREINISGNEQLKNKVDLGQLKDDTNIEITWQLGSTAGTQKYQVKDLRGTQSHLNGTNHTDSSPDLEIEEFFTRIVDNNKLWCTTWHHFVVSGSGNRQTHAPYGSDNKPYYDKQDPTWTGDVKPAMKIKRVVVYDKVYIGGKPDTKQYR